MDLIARCRLGDRGAFEELLARHDRRIHSACLRLLGDAGEAADAAQEVFVQVWRSLDRFAGRSAVSTWMHGIAIHVCRQAIRRKRRERGRTGGSLDDPGRSDGEGLRLAETLADPSPAPDRGLEEQDAARHVQQALARIPDEFREAIVLREIQGMSYEEVGQALGVRAGTVKSRINRGRRALREALAAMALGSTPGKAS